MSTRMRISAAAALFALLFLAPSGVKSQPPPAEKPKEGKITGRVVGAGTGKPVPGVPVRVRQLLARTGPDGRFSFDNVPVGNWVLTADVVLSEGGFLGLFARKVRYWGFVTEWVEEGKEAVVEIPLVVHGDVDKTCRRCHPDRPTRTLPVQKCLHHSGKVLPPAMAAQAARYAEANEKARREKKPFWPPIRLEERKRPDGSVEFLFDCESCHTAHAPTDAAPYVIAPYIDRAVLCKGCHT